LEKELIINSSPTEVEIALLENGKLVEIHRQKTTVNFSVGDIFLGQVKKTMPSLNAAFLDIGPRKDAFLHYTDLGPQVKSLMRFTTMVINKNHNSPYLDNFDLEDDNIKNGKIEVVFPKFTNILVQVLKEPISTKGPRLSCEITIPGRFLVLTPFSDSVAVSKKIANNDERKRLKLLIESIKPKKFGVIVRTAAEGKKVADLHAEIKDLTDKWELIYEELRNAKEPQRLLSELDKTSSILRDLLSGNFTKIVVNTKEMHDSVRDYLKSIAPDRVKILQLHKGTKPIFDQFEITRQIKSAFGKTATLSSGAYIVIEPTEAMHVVDVNSGPKMMKKDQDDASLSINMEAAEEVARQLRLRDIGGLIVIDFIDMRNPDHKTMLYTAMKEFMLSDKAQHTVLPLSKFGLMQITRQRVKPAVQIDTQESCPTCKGTGIAAPSILITDSIERDLEFIMQNMNKPKLTLHVHPIVKAYVQEKFYSLQRKWYLKYSTWIKVSEDSNYPLLQYEFKDRSGDKIVLD
jgi:ribonuclease G